MKDNKRRGEAMGTINEKSMSKLLLLYAEDKALLDILYDALKSFEEYHFAEEKNLPLVYDGTVSEDIPYRKEVADAVLEYVENKVRKRR